MCSTNWAFHLKVIFKFTLSVFDTIFQSLQKCFESRNIELLQETISKMPEDEAKCHLKRCVDSGLWIADASSQAAEKTEDGAAVKTEQIYEELGASTSTTKIKPTITTDDVD